jgi:hypothetical protein
MSVAGKQAGDSRSSPRRQCRCQSLQLPRVSYPHRDQQSVNGAAVSPNRAAPAKLRCRCTRSRGRNIQQTVSDFRRSTADVNFGSGSVVEFAADPLRDLDTKEGRLLLDDIATLVAGGIYGKTVTLLGPPLALLTEFPMLSITCVMEPLPVRKTVRASFTEMLDVSGTTIALSSTISTP